MFWKPSKIGFKTYEIRFTSKNYETFYAYLFEDIERYAFSCGIGKVLPCRFQKPEKAGFFIHMCLEKKVTISKFLGRLEVIEECCWVGRTIKVPKESRLEAKKNRFSNLANKAYINKLWDFL